MAFGARVSAISVQKPAPASLNFCAGPFANGELVNDLDRAARHAYTRRPSTLVGGNGMNYELPILSPQHAAFCRAEAERRYEAKLIRDRYGMLVAEDATGVTHTDAVLRALSYYREGKLSLYEIFLNRVQQPYVREAMDKSQRKFEDTPDDRTNVLGAQMELFIHGLFTATCVDWFAEHKKAREADKPWAKKHIYEPNIQSPEHAAWCGAEAERRYKAELIRDGEMLLAEDANGTCHTDAVLRALSFYKEPGGDAITQWVLASNGAAYGCSAANKRRGISARKRGLSASFHAVPLLSPERKLDVVAFRRQLDEQEWRGLIRVGFDTRGSRTGAALLFQRREWHSW
jgi:hypothetical protein